MADPITGGIMAGVALVKGIIGGGIAADRLGKEIDREGVEMAWKFDVARQNINFSEQQFQDTTTLMYDRLQAQLNQIGEQYYARSVELYETGALPYFRQNEAQARLQSAQQRNLLRGEFTISANQERNQLFNQRSQYRLAEYENAIAQDRVARKAQLQAQAFFSAFLPGAGAAAGGIAEAVGGSAGAQEIIKAVADTAATGAQA